MNLKSIVILFALSSVLTSCARLYVPALYHNDIAYMPKPASYEKEKIATYASAGVDVHHNPNLEDELVSAQFNVSQGLTFNGFNVAYGGFASFGNYQTNDNLDRKDLYYFRNKSFGAVGGRVSINAFTNNGGSTDFRYLGVEAAYSHEFGDYAGYRSMLQNVNGYYVDPRVHLFSLGLTSEVIFNSRNNKDLQHGIRGFVGSTFGQSSAYDRYYDDDTSTDRMFRNLYPKASYFMKYKNYFTTFEVGSSFFFRLGYKF